MDDSVRPPSFPMCAPPRTSSGTSVAAAPVVKALTTDVETFYKLCDPKKENLCLYGLSNETWEVTLPGEEVPPELPEPALEINFARDGMAEKDWLTLVAVRSDAWLIAVAFYFGARFGFDKDARFIIESAASLVVAGLVNGFQVPGFVNGL